MIVVDASAILELLLNTTTGSRVAARLFAGGETLHAPHLLDLEVAQVLRRYSRSGELSPERSREALLDFLDLPVNRYPHDLLLNRIWELRHILTAYDAAYVALAEALGAPLLTRDQRLASTAGHVAEICQIR
jgi:predicted nucleic acid-binding protein